MVIFRGYLDSIRRYYILSQNLCGTLSEIIFQHVVTKNLKAAVSFHALKGLLGPSSETFCTGKADQYFCSVFC